MAQEKQIKAEALRGYKFFPHPNSATLGVLRLDTENEQHWFLVNRETLLKLSDELQKHATDLQGYQ